VRVIERLCDPLQDRLHILHQLIIPEAQYSITLLHQKSSPSSVRLLLCSMLSTIQFYNQTVLWATEVGNVVTDGMLSSEFSTIQPSVTKLRPKPALSFSLITTQSTGAISRC